MQDQRTRNRDSFPPHRPHEALLGCTAAGTLHSIKSTLYFLYNSHPSLQPWEMSSVAPQSAAMGDPTAVQEGHKAPAAEIKCWCSLGMGRRAGRKEKGRQPPPAPRGAGGTLKFTSSFVLSMGVVAFHRHPVPVPRHLLPAPVLFQVELSEHGAMVRGHPPPGPVIRDPWVCETFAHDSPMACMEKNHRQRCCPRLTRVTR